MSYYYSTTNPNPNPNPSSSHSVSSSSSSFQNNGKEKKKRGTNNGVKLSTDPQSVAARERRHRISDRFKILQSLVPGGSKMDTVSMLEEAINYVKFLKTQIWLHNLMSVMDEDPYNNNNNNNDDVVYLPSNSANVLPQQPPFYLDAEIEAEMQRSLQLPDSSFFQGEAMVGHGPFDKARYL